MTKAQRVNYLASTAGLLATTFGEVFALPSGKGAVEWCSGPLRAILWNDANDARIDLFHNNRKVMATAWRPGASRHDVIAYKRGPWEQVLETAVQGMLAGLTREVTGGTLH